MPNTKNDIKKLAQTPHEVLRYVLPDLRGGYVNHKLQKYYYNLLCPELVILRTEHGTSADTGFLTYVLEAHGRELTVLSCSEYTRDGVIDFEAGYPYLKVPDAQCTAWDYRMNKEINVCCRSSFQAGSKEILLVERRMCYDDGTESDAYTLYETYVAELGITRIECKP